MAKAWSIAKACYMAKVWCKARVWCKAGVASWRVFLFRPAFFLALFLFITFPSGSEPVRFILLHTSDTHGRIEPQPDPTSDAQDKPLIGGYAAAKTALDRIKLEAYLSGALPLYFDGGDTFQGTPVVDQTKGSCMMDLMNKVHVAAATLGNHDFDYGQKRLKETISMAHFPIVNCNVFETIKGSLLPGVRSHILIPWRGRILGLTGILSPETPRISIPENVLGIEFRDPKPILRKLIPELRSKGADYIVVLSHLGIEDDKRLASAVPEIDLILGAHSHTTMQAPEYGGTKPIPIFHAGDGNRFIVRADIEVEKGKGTPSGFKTIPLYLKDFPEDPEIKAVVASYMVKINKLMKETIGVSRADLFRGVVGGDSPEGSFIADAMREGTGSDFAFMNLGGVRNPIFKGNITVEDIFILQPFPNTVEVLCLSGIQIRRLVEETLSVLWNPITAADKDYVAQNFRLNADGLKREFIASFGYLIPSNLHVTYDPERPPMNRIVTLTTADGKELDPGKVYRVAFNSYISAGGDGFSELKAVTGRDDSRKLVRELVMEKIRSEKGIPKAPEQRMFNMKLTTSAIGGN